MYPMTSIERIKNILKHKPVDRIGLYEHVWYETRKNWEKAGCIKENTNIEEHFGFDINEASPFNFTANLDVSPEIINETEDAIYARDGNGVVKRTLKSKPYVNESVDFLVKERGDWEAYIKPSLGHDKRRINFDEYRNAKNKALRHNRFFVCSTLNVFELLRCVCGHENMLVGMALDPNWIKEMVNAYSDLIIELQETLFASEGVPDGIWYSEDLGYKGTSFISLTMYRELIQAAHKKTFEYAHSRGIPVIVHSCGMVEKLIPGLIESGIDCLQALEVKAGMNLVDLYNKYGKVISFIGGIDVRTLFNNKQDIDRELEAKIPFVKANYGYVLHSDHSIPENVEYDMYKYFVDKGLKLGTY